MLDIKLVNTWSGVTLAALALGAFAFAKMGFKPSPSRDRADDPEQSAAFKLGHDAYYNPTSNKENQFREGSAEHENWNDGYASAWGDHVF